MLISMTRAFCAALLLALPLSASLAQGTPGDSIDLGWPRAFTASGTTFHIYQPQLESWNGNQLTARAAIAVTTQADTLPTFGVVNFSARTEVDKVNRTVYLNDFAVLSSNFPSAPAQAPGWLATLARALPTTSRAFALDRLEADLSITQAKQAVSAQPVENQPPRIFVSTVPAMLVLVEGAPSLQAMVNNFQRVINTRALLVQRNGTWYVHVFNGWMSAAALTGPWTVVQNPGPDFANVIAAAGNQVDLLTGASADTTKPRPSLSTPPAPVIYVSSTPAELVVTSGAPDFVPINGTDLLYATNTTGRLFRSISSQQIYLLIAGRWFSSATTDGPWTYVPGTALPADFRNIPDTSPVENVKASVPGTPQAQEAAIANQVPQTATVQLSTQLNPQPNYDGAPIMQPIEGTTLQYVSNSSTPVIMVNASSYYAVQNGIWFTGSSVIGPWAVATSVPTAIYTIPITSPLYYVTNVQVYGATSTVAYVGYTPGYYGTVLTSDGVVVYGTGYVYTPWIGSVWYPAPVTYGFGAAIRYTPWTGWSVGFGYGWGFGAVTVGMTWGAWGWGAMPYWGPAYGGFYGVGAYGMHGYAAYGPGGWAGTTGNVYSRWGSTSMVSRTSGGYNAYTGNRWGTQVGTAYNSRTGVMAAGQRGTMTNAYTGNSVSGARGAMYDPRTGQSVSGSVVRGPGGNVYAGQDGNVYRQNDDGSWDQRSGGGWQSAGSGFGGQQGLNQSSFARSMGNQRWGSFQGAGGGGFGGFAGGGFRGGGGGFRR